MVCEDISKSVRRTDAVSKSTGEAKYLPDWDFPGALWARMIRSSIPRGRIIGIRLPELPEGYGFVSASDIPGRNCLHMIDDDWKCFAEGTVNFAGEAIGLLVGPDKTVLTELEKLVQVDYEELEACTTMDEALALKGGAFINDDNIACHLKIQVGSDVDKVFESCDRIVSETIETGYQEHIYLETNGACCVPEEDGRYTIYSSCQCPYYVLRAVQPLLGLDQSSITVRQTTTGGGFGGKENYPDVLAGPVLVAAYKMKKPVKLIFDREEDIANSVKRHPSRVVFKTGLDKDGNILAMDSKVYYNVGACMSSSFVVLQRGCFHVTGCYSFPNMRSEGFGVATNNYPSCAFRGFGAPQTLFAIETHMNHLAQMQDLDPLEFKSRYFIRKGDRTSTNGHIIEQVMIPEMLKQVTEASDYWNKARSYRKGCGKGIGIALYNHGGAFTGNGEQAIIKGKARLHKYPDGTVEILCSQTEMGQGFHTVLPKIAAKVLEIPMDMIIFRDPDTSRVPDSGPTVASRSTMIVGKLVEEAALEMKKRYQSESEFETEASYKHPEGYPWDQNTFQGDAYLGYGWGVVAVEVEVDPCTAEVTTKGVWSSHDVGHVMDSLICHGQVNGGVVQALGWASTEVMDSVNGRFKQTSMSDYIVPTSMDQPSQGVFFVDNPYQWGPFGAKGMGELVFNGAAGAYIDAVSRAIDRSICSIPCPTEAVMGHILHSKKLGEL